MNAQVGSSALDSASRQPVATAEAAPLSGSVFSVLDAPASQPLLPVASSVAAPPSVGPDGQTRLVILDHPDVAPMIEKIVGQWGDLTGLSSSLDVIRYATELDAEIDRFHAANMARVGKMEASVFLSVANSLVDGAEKGDAEIAEIERDAEKEFRRPFLVKLAALVSEAWAKKLEDKRLPGVVEVVQSRFQTGGERINAWIEKAKTETEDVCRSQIEGIKRQELSIKEAARHEILSAAYVGAGYAIIDAATAAMERLPERERQDQLHRIQRLNERLGYVSVLYSDMPGSLERAKIRLQSAVSSLSTTMSSSNTNFVMLRRNAAEMVESYLTRAVQQLNARQIGMTSALAKRNVAVLGEVATAAVGMAADNAKKLAATQMSIAQATLKIVNDLKAAEKTANEELAAASKELAESQRLMLELREKSSKMA